MVLTPRFSTRHNVYMERLRDRKIYIRELWEGKNSSFRKKYEIILYIYGAFSLQYTSSVKGFKVKYFSGSRGGDREEFENNMLKKFREIRGIKKKIRKNF